MNHDRLHDFISNALPGVSEHVWISTWILGAMLVLAYALSRHAHAKTRSFLLMLGFLKFLLPVAAFASLRELLGLNANVVVPATAMVVSTAVGVVDSSPQSEAGCVMAAFWLVGIAAIVSWAIGRHHLIVRELNRGREEVSPRERAMLDSIVERSSLRGRVLAASSDSVAAPAVIGYLRTTILLPRHARDLSDAELAAVLTHEIAHVRRRDNLIGTLQMLVCSLFWFHPLVWLAHRSLLAAREQACDEEVLRADQKAEDYVSGILKICRGAFSPRVVGVSCMAAGELKKRMVHVMSYREISRRFVPHRLIALAAVLVLASVAALTAGVAERDLGKEFRLEAKTTSIRDGVFRTSIQVFDRSGKIVTAPSVELPAGIPAEIKSIIDGREIRVKVSLNDKGNGPVTLEIYKEGTLFESSTFLVVADEQPKATESSRAAPISLRLKDAEIKDVLRTFAQITDLNIAIEPEISGRITIEFEDEPWDLAFDEIIRQAGLAYTVEKGVVRVFRPTTPSRVGGDVKAPIALVRVDAKYTDDAKRARIQGIVILEVTIDKTGAVRDARVLKGLPFGLDVAAIDAVKQWKFQPALKSGQPVDVVFNLTINFKLEEQEAKEPAV